MSEEANKKTAEQLRRYAEERRREAGADWEMPRVTANLLRAESERRWGRARARPRRLAGGWLPWGLAFGLGLVLGLVWEVDRRSKETRTALLSRSAPATAPQPGKPDGEPVSELLGRERRLSERIAKASQPPGGPRGNAEGIPAEVFQDKKEPAVRFSEQLAGESEAKKPALSNKSTAEDTPATPLAAAPLLSDAVKMPAGMAAGRELAVKLKLNETGATTWFFKRADAGGDPPQAQARVAGGQNSVSTKMDLAVSAGEGRRPESGSAQDRSLGLLSGLRSTVPGGALGLPAAIQQTNGALVAANQKAVDGLAGTLAVTTVDASAPNQPSAGLAPAAAPPPPGPVALGAGVAGEEREKLVTAKAKEASPTKPVAGNQLAANITPKQETIENMETSVNGVTRLRFSARQNAPAAQPARSAGPVFRILDSFNLTRQGNLVTITDSDGSVYQGSVKPAANAVPALQEASKDQPAQTAAGVVAGGRGFLSSTNSFTTFGNTVHPGDPFQVSGTNISTRTEVALDGYLADTEEKELKEMPDNLGRGLMRLSNTFSYQLGYNAAEEGGGGGGGGGFGGGGGGRRAAGAGGQKPVDEKKAGAAAVTNAVSAGAGAPQAPIIFGRVTLGRTNQMEIRANGVAGPPK